MCHDYSTHHACANCPRGLPDVLIFSLIIKKLKVADIYFSLSPKKKKTNSFTSIEIKSTRLYLIDLGDPRSTSQKCKHVALHYETKKEKRIKLFNKKLLKGTRLCQQMSSHPFELRRKVPSVWTSMCPGKLENGQSA